MSDIRVVALSDSAHGPCACCGDTTRTVWGEARTGALLRAVYYVRWSPEHLDEHAVWLLYIGRWGDGASAADRVAVALHCRSWRAWPAFMVVDARYTPWGESAAEMGRPLGRAEVVGQPIGHEAYAIVDQVLAHDTRVTNLMRTMLAAEPRGWRRWGRWIANRWGIGRRTHQCSQRPASPEASR